MSTRRLAGSRRNKHLPIARRSTRSDRLAARCENRADRYRRTAARAAEYDPGTAAVWRLIVGMFHDPAQGSKPGHAARAVDIHTIWPPLPAGDSTAVSRKAAEAGSWGHSAKPMSLGRRINAYQRQNEAFGRKWATHRQSRQVGRMEWRARFAAA